MLPMKQKIEELISKRRIMLFIEGTVEFPTDIQSEAIVKIVRDP
jgi:glutaredoxin-related protein